MRIFEVTSTVSPTSELDSEISSTVPAATTRPATHTVEKYNQTEIRNHAKELYLRGYDAEQIAKDLRDYYKIPDDLIKDALQGLGITGAGSFISKGIGSIAQAVSSNTAKRPGSFAQNVNVTRPESPKAQMVQKTVVPVPTAPKKKPVPGGGSELDDIIGTV